LQINQVFAFPQPRPPNVAAVSLKPTYAFNTYWKRLKVCRVHYGFYGFGLFRVALAEEYKRKVQILRRGETSANRTGAQFVTQSKQARTGIGVKVYGYEKAHYYPRDGFSVRFYYTAITKKCQG
jgi:hypothetical protein